MEKEGEYFILVTTQVAAIDIDKDEEKSISVTTEDTDDDDISMMSYDRAEIDFNEEIKKVPFSKILGMNSPESLQIAVGVLTSAIIGCAIPVFAVLSGDIIGVLQSPNHNYIRSETNIYCIYFVIAGIAAAIATFIQIYMFAVAGEKLVMRVRGQMFETMLKQEIGWFDRKENGVGALCAKLSSEVASIQGATGQKIGTIVQSLTTLCLAVGLSLYYEWRLGLVALSFTPFILAAVLFQHRLVKSESEGFRKALEASTKLAVEAVGNIRTVVSLGCERTFYILYVNKLVPYTIRAKKYLHFKAFMFGLARSVMYFAYAASMYYGGYLVRTEHLDFTKVLKVSQALIVGTISIANALAFTPDLQKGVDAAYKIFILLDRIPAIRNSPYATNEDWKVGNIGYIEVYFSYPARPDMPVLRGLNLEILSGKTIALVGPSGCGKSTIIQLIERYYDPDSGYVTVDDQNIRDMTLESLRSNLGIVSQEPNLFDRTIADNIAYGDNSRVVTDEEVFQAARDANIHTFIASLPLGYNTPLGDKATQLSGGQKQRIAIARALIRNPKVLLLDEATSALDTESEKVVQEALDKAKEGRTCITIAHRLTTIQDADVICVMNDGSIFEMGTHTELLAVKGIYYELQSLQSGSK